MKQTGLINTKEYKKPTLPSPCGEGPGVRSFHMKTKNLIILGILLYFAGTYWTVTAQTVEKQVENTIYVWNTSKKGVENKENILFKTIDFSRDECHGVVLELMSKRYPELRKIFPEERTKEWGDTSIGYNIICDSTGLIHEVRFILSVDDLNYIPLSDLKKLEDYLKQVKLDFKPCPGKEYYKFTLAVSHGRLYGKK
jgi:hypothetical protein